MTIGGMSGTSNVIYSSFYEYKLDTHEPYPIFLKRSQEMVLRDGEKRSHLNAPS